MSSIKYATEENIKYLITLIRDELLNYVKEETFRVEIDKLAGFTSPLSFEKVTALPNQGETNVIYIIPNGKSEGDDMYDEYFWDEEDEKFERFGSVGPEGSETDKNIPDEEIDKLFGEDD